MWRTLPRPVRRRRLEVGRQFFAGAGETRDENGARYFQNARRSRMGKSFQRDQKQGLPLLDLQCEEGAGERVVRGGKMRSFFRRERAAYA